MNRDLDHKFGSGFVKGFTTALNTTRGTWIRSLGGTTLAFSIGPIDFLNRCVSARPFEYESGFESWVFPEFQRLGLLGHNRIKF